MPGTDDFPQTGASAVEAGELSVVALMTSHNRRDTTLACWEALAQAAEVARIRLTGILVDDGSSDGTAEAVAARFPWVSVIHGDGSLFWNRGMHRAQAEAFSRHDDVLLWVNDDTLIKPDALARLRQVASDLERSRGAAIVVGATADRHTGELSYSGQVMISRVRRFNYRRVWSATEPVECEVMNGNLVWIPRPVADRVGNLDPVYEHAWGDLDYALRARRLGIPVYVAPGIAGYCSRNATKGSFLDRSLPLSERWRKVISRKGLPPRSWWYFARTYSGLLAPVYFVWPYLRVVLEGMSDALSRRSSR